MKSEKTKIDVNIDINDFKDDDENEEDKKLSTEINNDSDINRKRKTILNSLTKSLDKSK